MVSAEDVSALFNELALNDAERRYIEGQSDRLAYLVNLVQKYVDRLDRRAKLLDFGPHFLTRCIIDLVAPSPEIWTIGYAYDKLVPANSVIEHKMVDINACNSSPQPFSDDFFDIIMICELIEHLLIPPNLVFAFAKPMLASPNGVIICGTPNAVSISKRLKMMMGENPFQPLFEDWKHFRGHVREYTMSEICNYGNLAGLSVEMSEYCNYWQQYLFPSSVEISQIENKIPMFMGGLTIVFSLLSRRLDVE